MGLDITVYANVRLIEVKSPETDEERDDLIEIEGNRFWLSDASTEDFPAQAEGMSINGVYEYASKSGFRAGSYHGYNEWRDQLSRMALKVSAETVWHNSTAYAGKPFIELINFSDCEGWIGPKVAAKLAEDFRVFQAEATKQDSWFYETYERFMNAFATAAYHGAVKFH